MLDLSTSRDVLESLCALPGLSGFEDPVRDVMVDLTKSDFDQVSVDGMGNLIGTKVLGDGRHKMLISAHMDEIGFLVSHIRPDGFLRAVQVGKGLQEGKSFDCSVLPAQRVDIVTEEELIPGVIGYPKIFHHAAQNTPYQMHELFIDVGANDADEVRSLGVECGQQVVFRTPWLNLLGSRVASKALDCRAPSLALAQAAALVARDSPEVDMTLYFAWTVQKKVGEKGIKAVCTAVAPDVAVSVDSSLARDLQVQDENVPSLGAGPSVRMAEGYYGLRRGLIPDRRLYNAILEAARQMDIPCQVEIVQGYVGEGKDIQVSNQGVPTCAVGIPIRNMLGPVQIADVSDVCHSARLIAGVVRVIAGLLSTRH